MTPILRCPGVDAGVLKKGRTYGTSLCELERHQVIKLWDDREGDTLAKWLKDHPHVEIITRDRASAYADGTREGAQQSISDRRSVSPASNFE